MPHTYKFEYAVIGSDGQASNRFPLNSRFNHLSGVVNLAAEDYHKRPEAARVPFGLCSSLHSLLQGSKWGGVR